MKKRVLSTVLALVLVLGLSSGALATEDPGIDELVSGSAAYIYSQVPEPQMASIGGEWAVLGLARAGYSVPQSWYDDYYAKVESDVEECGGILDKKKYTEYDRVIVALSAIGKDARCVAGYDLTTPLGNYEKTIWQGNNGPIWALIALDSADYSMPQNPAAETQATRQMYIDLILSVQLSDGGWVLDNTIYTISDPDMTGMALQALAKYADQPEVAVAIERGLNCVSDMIKNRNLLTYASTTSESIDQVLVALCELGVDYRQDKYMKDGVNLLDALLRFRGTNGSFRHDAAGTGDNQMSAEQGLYTLVAVQRFLRGQNSLYRMTDVCDFSEPLSIPTVTGGSGYSASFVLNPDNSAVISVKTGKTAIELSTDAYDAAGSTYEISSSNGAACIAAKRTGDTFSKTEIRTSGQKHYITFSASDDILLSVKGDVSNDGTINASDWSALISAFKKTNSTSGNLLTTLIGDVTGDGTINAADWSMLIASFKGTVTIPW